MNALSPTEVAALLTSCPVFAPMPAEDVALLGEIMRTERFRAGQKVCVAGETASEVYVIADGTLGVSLPGDARIVRQMRRGEILGEYGMFGRGVRTATVEAQEDAVLLSLDYERFREFLLAFPASTLALLEVTVQRMTSAEAEARKGG